MDYTFEMKEQPAMPIVCFHHTGDMKQLPQTMSRLVQWALSQGLAPGPSTPFFTIYRPDKEGLHPQVGMVIPSTFRPDESVESGMIPGGLYAVGHFELDRDEISLAWNEMFQLISKAGALKAKGVSFEIYRDDAAQHAGSRSKIDICVPVRPADRDVLRQKAEALLARCGVVVLSSLDENGFPRPVPVSPLKAEGISTIWFSTGTVSDKTRHFRADTKAGVCFWDGGDSVVVTGNVQIETDQTTKKALWAEWMLPHFPAGVNDPNYCVLRFTTQNITYWIDNEFVKIDYTC